MFSPPDSYREGIKPVFFIILLFESLLCNGQINLVPNGSFEEYYSCPTGNDNGDGQFQKCKYWEKPNYATSDYFNSCALISSWVSVPSNFVGYQLAYDGNAYIGLVLYTKGQNIAAEYGQCKLNSPLKPCYKYVFTMSVSLSDYSAFAISSIGMRVDVNPLKKELNAPDQYDAFDLPPTVGASSFITDTTSWVKISGEFVAQGGESYLTIGRFIDTLNYSNSNFPVMSVNCDSCFAIDDQAYYYIDSVQLIEIGPVTGFDSYIPNVITANNDEVNDIWKPNDVCSSNWLCSILNRWGEEVFRFNQDDLGWNGLDQNGDKLTEGTYFYIITSENENKLTGFIQLIR